MSGARVRREARASVVVQTIGRVRSPLTRTEHAPRQADEDAPPAQLEIDPPYLRALDGIRTGDEIVVVTWLHEADRETLVVQPRNDEERPLTGVFATRSADRPNPIGLHEVTVVAVDGERINVAALEAIDGTPILDLKPRLGPAASR